MRSASEQSGQLLQELEALSHALYKSQSIPTAPSSDSIPPPRREFDRLSHRRRVSEAAGRPPRSSTPAETRHSISEIPTPLSNPKSDSSGAIPVIAQEKAGHQDDQAEESVIDLTHKKKGGIWSWKPLRALAHIGQQRLHCEFSAHVHSIDKLPSSMNGLRLQVHLRHRETGVHTAPVRVSTSSAEFEELLHFRCSVYASSSSSKSKSSGNIKYMSKSFTLSVIPVDVEELDLGKHQLDLSRILPSDSLPTPSQASGSSSSTGSWSTSFKLSGKARGGVLWVTLGYRILEGGGGSSSKVGSSRFGFSPGNLRGGGSGSRSFNSLPSSPHTSMNLAPGVLKQSSGKPATEFGSPAMSEPGNEYGDMEQLDLDQDEPPRLREFGGKDSNSNSNSNMSSLSSSWKPPLPGKKAIETVEHRGRPLFDDNARSKVEDEGEFSIVEHGVETSVLDEQDRNVFEEQKEEQEEDEDGEAENEEKALPSVGVVNQTKDYDEEEEEEAPEELKQQDVDDEQEDGQEQEKAAVEEEQVEQEEAAEEEREEEKPGEEPEPEEAEPVETIGLENYDWKRELEEDDLYDSLRNSLQNPSPKSSAAAVPVDDYWKPEEQSEVDKYWKQQEDQSDVETYWKREEPNEVEVEVPIEDLYKIEYQGAESEDGRASEMKGGPGDDLDDLVADEFLDMLSPAAAAAAPNPTSAPSDEYLAKDDEEPDSPRALLLKQFEQEALLDGGFGLDIDETDVDEAEVAAHLSFGSPIVPAFNLDEDEEPPGKLILQQQRPPLSLDSPPKESLNRVASEEWISDEDKELAAIMDAAETELQKATQAMKSKARAKMLEDAEAEALLQEWGLDENVFHDEEPAAPSDEPTSSAETSIVLRQGLPALAPGMGPSVPTADGGSLRSMDSSHFQNGKNDGKLVMHVSKPVVVPAEMGSTAIDVLRNLAAAGTETMAAEAMTAMPLDDVTGKSVQQIALEGQVSFDEHTKRYDAALVASNRSALEDGTLALPTTSSSLYQPKQKKGGSSDFLQLDELAPVAMEKIEELAMQGLKIQCDMADEDAPYVLDPVQNVPLLKGSGSSSNLLLAAGSSEGSSDGLISMSLSLDEWMRLDAGVDEDEDASDKTKSIMAAHRAAHTTTDLVLNLSGEREQEGATSSGKMGNTLTLAMLVQLRDPLRNFEPVGAPMMALVEAERVLVPPRPKLWKRVALKGNSEAEYNEDVEEKELPPQPQFKITGVHMAGLNVQEDVKDSKKKQQVQLWGNQRQQQSGSRWLVANGMTKTVGNKHPLLKSSSKPSKGRQGESSLWSISSRAAPESVQPLTRNPDVKFGKVAAASGFRKR